MARKTTLDDDSVDFDVEYWQQFTPEQRLEATWQATLDWAGSMKVNSDFRDLLLALDGVDAHMERIVNGPVLQALRHPAVFAQVNLATWGGTCVAQRRRRRGRCPARAVRRPAEKSNVG